MLILEAEHGPLPGTSPALIDVLNYLEKVLLLIHLCFCSKYDCHIQLKYSQNPSKDSEMRQTIHSLLAHEGTQKSQMV